MINGACCKNYSHCRRYWHREFGRGYGGRDLSCFPEYSGAHKDW